MTPPALRRSVSGDLDRDLYLLLVAGLPEDTGLWAEHTLVLEFARQVCRRGSRSSRPDLLAATRSLLTHLNQRLPLWPELHVFTTALESRLPVTELLAHASGPKN
jgi:hypothetical protein